MLPIRIDDTLMLRLFEEQDAAEFYALMRRNEDRLHRWLSPRHVPTSLDAMNERIARARQNAGKGTALEIMIVLGGVIVGRCTMFDIDKTNAKAEIGYWLDAGLEGKGIATKACKAMLEYAFNGLELNRIQLRTHPGNAKSVAVAERLGFRLEGIMRQEFRGASGHYEDSALYSLLAQDWRG
ncbi:MAG: GNAT family N-acetyltransferase [Planctomycetes bacterium]|nr:GNAT family N-acetyltransferase [Planctomycetota bacterium]NUQ34915.1 GNAT family N-acetyltransferase [Planctomycetaceae bacterium]